MRNLKFLAELAMENSPPGAMREQILSLIATNQKSKATEYLTEFFLKQNKIYSIRDDNIKEVWIYEDGVYVPNGITRINEFVRQVLGEAYTTHFANNVINKIMADTGINHQDFFKYDLHPNHVPVRNGIFNLSTGLLEEFDKEKRFFFKFDVNYDADADCPKIKNYLKEILICENDYITVQEMFGWLFYKEYRFEKIFMFTGNGRNGKSKLLELLKIYVGATNVINLQPCRMEDTNSFNLGELYGKIANISPDIEPTGLKHTSVLKSASGGDLLTANRKFKNPIAFVNTAKMIFGANDLPITYDTKSAFWQRWILIECPYEFIYQDQYDKKKEEKRFYNKIRDDDIIKYLSTEEELSGLFNFAYEGYLRLQKNKKFSYRYSPDEVQSRWVSLSNSFAAFYNDYLEIDYTKKMTKKELRKAYVEYCKDKHIKIMSDRMIKFQLENEGIIGDRWQRDHVDEYIWEGLRFKEQYERLDYMTDFSYYKPLSLMEKIKYFLEKNPENNLAKLNDFFGGEKIKDLLKKGSLIEIPVGTLKINQ